MNRSWLVLLIPLLYGHVAVASDRATLEEEDLSGTWTGVLRVRQLGKCTWRDKKMPVTFELTTRSDGEFSMTQVVSKPSPDQMPTVFSGKILKDLQTIAGQTNRVVCKEEERVYESDYKGFISRKKKRIVLELTGRNLMCPEMGCEFEMNLRLEKKLSPGSSD